MSAWVECDSVALGDSSLPRKGYAKKNPGTRGPFDIRKYPTPLGYPTLLMGSWSGLPVSERGSSCSRAAALKRLTFCEGRTFYHHVTVDYYFILLFLDSQ